MIKKNKYSSKICLKHFKILTIFLSYIQTTYLFSESLLFYHFNQHTCARALSLPFSPSLSTFHHQLSDNYITWWLLVIIPCILPFAYSMHFVSSSSHSVIFSKYCTKMTSSGVNMFSDLRILKQSLAEFACFREVTSSTSQESKIPIFLYHYIWLYFESLIKIHQNQVLL